MSSKLRIVVSALIAQHPRLGGVAWDYTQYLIGLAAMGHDVYYIEDSGEWPYDLGDETKALLVSPRTGDSNAVHLQNVMRQFNLDDRWAYHCACESKWYGLSDRKRHDVISSADLLLNVSGSLWRPMDYRKIPRLVYIDTDPVFTQVKLNLPKAAQGLWEPVSAHDIFFTFGETLPDKFLTGHYHWRPTRHPIVMSQWRPSPAPAPADRFTTIMSWTSYEPLSFAGVTYGQKDVEFKRFLGLPSRVGKDILEVAVAPWGHPEWESDSDWSGDPALGKNADTVVEYLKASGWGVSDSSLVCGNMERYRQYIESSSAEWSVAKSGYVVGKSGWFSGRSASYLAAGKPVVVQDTGYSQIIPVGEGVLPFVTFDDAAQAIEDVRANYKRHSKAARDIAEAYFDAEDVLSKLIEEAMNAG